MAETHEFGIMPTPPQKNRRYDEYEPLKYSCISVHDDCLSEALGLNNIDFYHHTLSVRGKGLAYCGITLIPPCSLPEIMDVVRNMPGLSKLYLLTEKALTENRWIIHFGI